jgi:Mg/Co/Ni transporter MgtE
LGNIHWDADKKTAIIRVLDPADYKLAYSEMLQDLEFTVVHELIHLELSPVLSPLQRNDANRREEEHAVNHMADALLKMDRQNRALVNPPQQTAQNQQ